MERLKTLLLLPLCFSLALEAGSWIPPSTLGEPTSNYPDVAMDSNGNAIAVWVYTQKSGTSILASTRPAGGSWSTPAMLTENNLRGKYGNVAFDKNGNALAIWSAATPEDTQVVQAAFLPVGSGRWIPTQIPIPPAFNIITPPRVAFDSEGNALAAWGASSESDSFIQTARLSSSTRTWKAAPEIPLNDISTLSMALDPSGNCVLLWKGSEGIQSATLLHDSNLWTQQNTLSTESFLMAAQVSVDGQGRAIATWWEGMNFSIKAMILPLGGKEWQKTQFPEVYAFYPRLAVDAAGNAHILWSSYGTDQPYTFQSSILGPTESTWTKPVTLLPAVPDFIPYYGIGVDPSGNAVAFWANHTKEVLQATTRNSGKSSWTTPVNIASIRDLEGWPKIALSSEGACAIVYNESTESQEIHKNIVRVLCGSKMFPFKSKKQ